MSTRKSVCFARCSKPEEKPQAPIRLALPPFLLSPRLRRLQQPLQALDLAEFRALVEEFKHDLGNTLSSWAIKSNRGWFSVAGKVPKFGTTSRAVLHNYVSRVSVGAGLARGGKKRRQVRYVVGRVCRDCVSSLLVRVKGEKLLPKRRVRKSGGLPVLKQEA